ncbi:MAG: hypothetical protein KC620_25815, partial [Myxococcales bacterium]|nr:hypothetical protein [Myxococcales bacterium]
MRALFVLALLVGVFAAPTRAVGGRFSAVLALEAWPDDNVPIHGIGLLAYDFDPWLAGGRPSAVLNTDTLRLGLDDIQLGDRWRVGLALAGEYAVAGLLTDYHVDGASVPERGFKASYVEAEARLKRLFSGGAWGELTLRGRRWFFARAADTAPDLALPPESYAFMPRLDLGWWRLADDAGWRTRHRFFPRLHGFAVGVQAGVDVRSASGPWGAADGSALRNDPETVTPLVRQWLLAGLPLASRLRLELDERAGYGLHEDDLTRARIGGLNPYVVPVPGAPWAAWLADRFVGGRLALAVRAVADVEVAPTVAAVYLRDVHRAGDDAAGVVWGAGATADA